MRSAVRRASRLESYCAQYAHDVHIAKEIALTCEIKYSLPLHAKNINTYEPLDGSDLQVDRWGSLCLSEAARQLARLRPTRSKVTP